MKNCILCIMFVFSGVASADFMDTFKDVAKSVSDTVKDSLDSEDEVKKVESVRTVTTVSTKDDTPQKQSLIDDVMDTVANSTGSKKGGTLLTDMVDNVKETVGIHEDKPKKKAKITTLYTQMEDEGVDTVGFSKDELEDKQETSLLGGLVDDAKDLMGIQKEQPKKKTSFLDDAIDSVKEAAGIQKTKENSVKQEDGIMESIADMIELEEGESYGLPSVFGLNKKKEKKVFGSTALGDTFLGDIKDSGTSFYKGFKTSGESTEFMSGIMYKSSKAYNKVFDMFDDSPLNVFEDEEESSLLDVFGKGNSVLDMFD